jgi:hypothetical protein
MFLETSAKTAFNVEEVKLIINIFIKLSNKIHFEF